MGRLFIAYPLLDTGTSHLLERLNNKGIEIDSLEALENCWLILDDAQNVYSDQYSTFWQFVVKVIASSNVGDKLFVIIAATYDYGTTGSPVQFKDLVHVHADISLEEASELFSMHAKNWGYEGWGKYLGALLSISKLNSGDHHVGVVVGGIRLLEESRKKGQRGFDESSALSVLRSIHFIGKLDRCFQLPATLPRDHTRLFWMYCYKPKGVRCLRTKFLMGLFEWVFLPKREGFPVLQRIGTTTDDAFRTGL